MARPSIVVLLITLVVGLAQAAHFNAMRGHVAQDFYAQNEYLLARSFLSVCLFEGLFYIRNCYTDFDEMLCG